MNKFSSLVAVLLLPMFCLAQSTIKGKIVDLRTRQWLPGTSVVLDGTTVATMADESGNYVLEIPASAGAQFSVTFSFTGYENQTMAVKADQKVVNVALAESASELKDVVVSANRKQESVQKVPMSISTISPVELRRNNALEFRDYASRIPNMSFGTQGGGGTAFSDGRTSNQIVIRGIGGAQATAFYLNETPLPETIDPRLIDVSRVEVLRGPQGTLYGSGSMGGAVKVITNRPDATLIEGTAMMQVGAVKGSTFDYNLEGVVNLPIMKNKLALRVAGFKDHQAGMFDRKIVNTITGLPGTFKVLNTNTLGPNGAQDLKEVDAKDKFGFHATLGYTPIKNLELSLTGMYQNFQGRGYDLADSCACNRVQKRVAGLSEKFSDVWGHGNFTAKYNAGFGKVVVNSSYTNRDYNEIEDESELVSSLAGLTKEVIADNGYVWAGTQQRGATFSKFVQEARFLSDFEGSFNFSAGLYYADEKLGEKGNSKKSSDNTPNTPNNPPVQATLQDQVIGGPGGDANWYNFTNTTTTKETAAFAELYYNVTDKFKITLGGRFFNAQRTRQYAADGFVLVELDTAGNLVPSIANTSLNITETGFNPRLILNYQIAKDMNVYASASRGFRLGGLNDAIPTGFCKFLDDLDSLGQYKGFTPPKNYKSDYVWTYELGFKSMLFDRRLMLNVAAFYNDWYDLQVNRRLTNCGFNFTSNIGRARSIGADLDLKYRITKGLDWTVGLGYADSRVAETDVNIGVEKDDRLLFTPEFSGSSSLQYTFNLNQEVEMFVRADAQYVGQRYSQFPTKAAATLLVPDPPRIVQPARVLDAFYNLNTRFGVNYKKYEFAFFINNLTDNVANYGDVNALGAELLGRPRYMRNRPLTAGVQARAFF